MPSTGDVFVVIVLVGKDYAVCSEVIEEGLGEGNKASFGRDGPIPVGKRVSTSSAGTRHGQRYILPWMPVVVRAVENVRLVQWGKR